MNCPKDAGNVVYLARALYFLQTGIVLDTNCGSILPSVDGAERNAQTVPIGDLLLVPNPADGYVEVSLPATIGEGSVFLTDMWGRFLLRRKITESDGGIAFRIPTDGIPNGIYIISVMTKSGSQLTKKLTIAH